MTKVVNSRQPAFGRYCIILKRFTMLTAIIYYGVKAALILSAAVVFCLVYRAITDKFDKMLNEMKEENK